MTDGDAGLLGPLSTARDRLSDAYDRATDAVAAGSDRLRDALGGGPDRAQVWVHPTHRYLGGTYDPVTGRVHLGSEAHSTHGSADVEEGRVNLGTVWAARVDRALESFDGDSIALTNAVEQEGTDVYVDGTVSTTIAGDHVHVPYGHETFDRIYEDPNGGALPPADVEDLFGDYDEVVVRGAYYGVCEREFVEVLAETLGDEVDVVVDAPDSAAWTPERETGGYSADPLDRSGREERRAAAPPSAAVDGRLIDRLDGDEYDDLPVDVDLGGPGDGVAPDADGNRR